MELNSLNTQHATLPTDTTHHPYHYTVLTALVILLNTNTEQWTL